MNKIRNFLMLVAVVAAVTGAFAFKTHKPAIVAGATTASAPPSSSSGGTLIFPPGTTFVDISGQTKGVHFNCNTPTALCFFIRGAESVVTEDQDGNVVVTDVEEVDNTGTYTPIP